MMENVDSIQAFGKKVLEYFLSNSSADDTILFAIDDDIYESTLFAGIGHEKEKFEEQIKNYVRANGLRFSEDKDIAIALAAHQIKLAYDSKNLWDKEENIRKSINGCLKAFYFSENDHDVVLYKNYYDSLKNAEDNLQDKLWKEIKNILNSQNRKCIIPVGLKGKNREQKYINAQLVILRSLKDYFLRVFFFAGISKNIIYTREMFEKCIESNLQENNSGLLGHVLSEIQMRLRQYATENDIINFVYDKKILIGQLWNFYNIWDGSEPNFSSYNDYYSDSRVLYIELYDEEDDNGEFYFESEEDLNYSNTGININNEIYFRLFSPHSEYVWKSEVINSVIPDYSPFVILVEKEGLPFFSEKNRIIYSGEDNNTNKYIAIKYVRKPDDFFDKLPSSNKQRDDLEKVSLVGGLKLHRNEYLDVNMEKIKPHVHIKYSKKIIEQVDDMKIFKIVSIIDSEKKIIAKYKMIPHSENSKPSNCEICRSSVINGLCIPQKKAVIKVNCKTITEISQLTFKAYLNREIIETKRYIPYEELLVLTKNQTFVRIQDFDKISDEYLTKLKRGVGLGFFLDDDGDPKFIEKRNLVKEIKFTVEKNPVTVRNYYQISEFEVIDIAPEKQYLNGGVIIVLNHQNLKGYHFRKKEHTMSPINNNYRSYDFKIVEVKEGGMRESSKACLYGNDLFCYQEALYLWLKHKGFATWQQIHAQCLNLVQTSVFFTDFGDNPIYKIFMPLLKIGIIELYQKNGEFIYCVSDVVRLMNSDSHIYSYRNHFFNTDDDTLSTVDNSKQAMLFFKELPSLYSQLQSNKLYYSTDESTTKEGYVTYDVTKLRTTVNFTKELSLNCPCVFKYKKEAYEPDYFFLESNSRYKLNRNIPDSMSVCKSFIHSESIVKKYYMKDLFTYFPSEQKLICHYFPDMPVIYARALILNNPAILKNDELYLSYCPNHYEQIFTNVSEKFVRLLDQKYTERS